MIEDKALNALVIRCLLSVIWEKTENHGAKTKSRDQMTETRSSLIVIGYLLSGLRIRDWRADIKSNAIYPEK